MAAHKKYKIIISKNISLKKKGSVRNDTLPKAPTKVPNNGATFKVKIRKRDG